MSMQRISWIERHVEKLVLGAGLLVVLGVVAMQFIKRPAGVDVLTEKGVPVSQAWDRLKLRADAAKAALNRPAAQVLPEAERAFAEANVKTDLGKGFRDALNGGVSPARRLASAFTPDPRVGGGLAAPVGPGDTVKLPELAGVIGRPMGRGFWSTIDPAEVPASPGLEQFVPKQAPLDKGAISIEATLDGPALRKLFRDAKLPETWYEPDTQIVAVLLERAAADDSGQPVGEPVAIATIPGRLNLMPEVKGGTLAYPDMVQRARERAADIQRPGFYARAMLMGRPVGPAYQSPSEALKSEGANNPALTRLESDLRELDATLARLRAELERVRAGARPGGGGGPAGGGGAGPAGAGGGTGPGAGGGSGKGPGAGPGAGSGRPGAGGAGAGGAGGAGAPPGSARERELNNRIRALEADRTRLVGEIDKLRTKPAGDNPAAQPGAGADRGVSKILVENTTLLAHDISAEPGKRYVYRMALVISNPGFGRPGLDPAQQDMAQQPTLTTAASAWSSPVRLDTQQHLFITSASAPSLTAGGAAVGQQQTARAEVFAFTWGHWRSGQVNVVPGDPIIASVQVPDVAAAAGTGGAGDGAGAGPGAGNEGGGGGTARPGQQPGAAPAAGGAIASKSVPIFTDAYLLDVSTAPEMISGVGGGARAEFQAVLRLPDGSIAFRLPRSELESSEFLRLREAAALGADQLRQGAGPADAPGTGGTPGTPGTPATPGPRPGPTPASPGGGGGPGMSG